MCEYRYGKKFKIKLARRRRKSIEMVKSFIQIAELALKLGGHISFEWPRFCEGWAIKELMKFIREHELCLADVDGCPLGMKTKDGEPILKQWRFICSSSKQATDLGKIRCKHPKGFKHGVIAGGETKKTELYPKALCRTWMSSLFGYHLACPSIPVGPKTPQAEHRVKEFVPVDFGASPMTTPIGFIVDVWSAEESSSAGDGIEIDASATRASALVAGAEIKSESLEGVEGNSGASVSELPTIPTLVTKLLDRKEMLHDIRAREAIKYEGQALLDKGTWLTETVMEKEDLLAWAQKTGNKIHLGDVMTICSIKFWERAAEHHKYKGRIVFRGDNVKDENGAVAVFQELSASPTAITTANANIAYGQIPGNKTTQADAVQAYLQSNLKARRKTWVTIPRELWPQAWIDAGMKRPCCVLQKALYGHPEAGGHWEKHLEAAVEKCGGEAVEGHPSSFWFASERLLLTVYVDDLLLSGPEENHDAFWQRLRHGPAPIDIEDPEPLGRFLGRDHVVVP